MKTNEERLSILEDRVDKLEKHDSSCDAKHEQHKEHNRRAGDAMNQLSESNKMLADSIAVMNTTLNKVVVIMERDEPDIEVLRNARIAWKVNKWMFLTLVMLFGGLATIYGFYKGLI